MDNSIEEGVIKEFRAFGATLFVNRELMRWTRQNWFSFYVQTCPETPNLNTCLSDGYILSSLENISLDLTIYTLIACYKNLNPFRSFINSQYSEPRSCQFARIKRLVRNVRVWSDFELLERIIIFLQYFIILWIN